jgi:hypothetical protein
MCITFLDRLQEMANKLRRAKEFSIPAQITLRAEEPRKKVDEFIYQSLHVL